MKRRTAPIAVATVAAVLAVVATGCGIGGDSELQQIDRNDLFGLDETTTTSSTSTTTTTLVPPSSTTPDPGRESTTTIAIEPVLLYFLDGNRLVDVSINLARDPSATRVMAALEAGPPTDEVGIGLRSVLPRNLITSVQESGEGFATVDLAAGPFEGVEPRDQRLAIAQIVLTLTRRPGIGQVQFTVEGEPLAVPGRDNVQTAPGALVSREDYQSLLLEDGVEEGTTLPPDTTTTETTVTPTTS